jgi:hypothetical protein
VGCDSFVTTNYCGTAMEQDTPIKSAQKYEHKNVKISIKIHELKLKIVKADADFRISLC